MNVFKLEAAIGLNTDEYESGLKAAGTSLANMGDKIKSGLDVIGKATVAAIGTASAGVVALTKQSVDAYANYEQLAGGIETLFGDSVQTVVANAEKAYKTAGMSMNEYMETSIQSAAAMINSLGGDQAKAAELMDMSIQDMSDNVNKMGTTMESVQNAYRGFSRGNFTMLDNLALGFAGTKEGMQELLDKAHELSGVEYDISSYADIVEAIHVVQTEMGITGTTAKEAAETISGSLSAAKASWDNLLVELSKPDGDVAGMAEILSGNISGVISNAVPKIQQAIGGISTIIETVGPQAVSALNTLMPQILPPLLQSATAISSSFIQTTVNMLPDIAHMIKDQLPTIMSGIGDVGAVVWDEIIVPSWDFVVTELPQLINSGIKLISSTNFAAVGKTISKFIVTGLSDISSMISQIDWNSAGKTLGTTITTLLLNVDWAGILKNVANVLGGLISTVPDILGGLYESAVDGFIDLFSDLGNINDGVENMFAGASDATKALSDEITDARNGMEEMLTAADDVAEAELVQISRAQQLWQELENIVDENGKVKEGYEARANYIVGELNSAIGTEISLVDGQIDKYKELEAEIDSLIQKKRVSALSSAYEESYQNALKESANAGNVLYSLQKQQMTDNAALEQYYNAFRADLVNRGYNSQSVSRSEYDAVKNMSLDDFRRSLGTGNAADTLFSEYFQSDYGAALGYANDFDLAWQSIKQESANIARYNQIAEQYESAIAAMSEDNMYLAEQRFKNISGIESGIYEGLDTESTNILTSITDKVNEATELWRISTENEVYQADETLRATILSLVEYGKEEGLTGAELMATGIVQALSNISSFDTSELEQFMVETGIKLGDLMSQQVFSSLSSAMQSAVTQKLYAENDLIVSGINSQGDVEAYNKGSYVLGVKSRLTKHAAGGIFRKETHIFGEDGDEAVIPLEHDERGIRQIADAISSNMQASPTINVTVNVSESIDNIDDIGVVIVNKIDEAMRNLSIRNAKAIGGTGW